MGRPLGRRSSRLARILALVIALVGPWGQAVAVSRAAEAEPFAAAIDAIVDRELAGARVGLSVRDAPTGRVLYARNATMPLNPASNVKILVSSAALAVLGPEHRYATSLLAAEGSIRGERIEGDLYLRGTGDPSLTTADLYALASTLRARNIRRITGRVVVDSARFDRDELPPGYDQKDELAAYRAPTGATSVDDNTYAIRVRPGPAAGTPVLVAVESPVPYIELRASATTSAGNDNRVVVTVEAASRRLRVIVGGQLGEAAAAARYRYPVPEPWRHAGEVMAMVLGQVGVHLGRTGSAQGTTPEPAEILAIHRSPPLSVLVRSINKMSNNFVAEQILKTLAPEDRPATFADALERVRAHLAEIGMSMDGLVLGNGSGLYDTNRVTAEQITHVLSHLYRDFRLSWDFLASLSVMGRDGTLRRRLRESPAVGYIRAKTGTLDDVSCLSGYVAPPGKRPLAFAVLIGGIDKGAVLRARSAQDRIAELLSGRAGGSVNTATSTAGPGSP